MEWKVFETPQDYAQTLARMEARVEGIIAGGESEAVWLLEHPPLYTAGTSAKQADLHDARRFPTYDAGRGGEWTYHGPGQRVAYVMLDLKRRAQPGAPDLRRYVQRLEQWIIATLARLNVTGEVRDGRIGVWVQEPSGQESKIAALGIRVRKWVSFHGISLNVNPDLSHYAGIVPCGINAHGVTSLHALGLKTEMDEVDAMLKEEFARQFG